MGKKLVPIEEEADKYNIDVKLDKRSGKAVQLKLDEVNTSLYADSAKTSGLATLRPVEYLKVFERYYEKIGYHWLNKENKDNKYNESQIFLLDNEGVKYLTIHVFLSTGVILVKGHFHKEWAIYEFPVIRDIINNVDSEIEISCPSKEFLDLLNSSNQSTSCKSKQALVDSTDKLEQPPAPLQNKSDDITEVFNSVESLWTENSKLKSSLMILETNFSTITETLSEIKECIAAQDLKIVENLKLIETTLDSKITVFTSEIQKEIKKKINDSKKEIQSAHERDLNNLRIKLQDEINTVSNNVLKSVNSESGITSTTNMDYATSIKNLEIENRDMSKILTDIEASLDHISNEFGDLKSSFCKDFNKIEERVTVLENRPFMVPTDCSDHESRLADLLKEMREFKEYQEKLSSRIQQIEAQNIQHNQSSDENIVLKNPPSTSNSYYQTQAETNTESVTPLKYSEKRSEKYSLKQDFTQSILLFMDSNRKFLSENKLSPDRNRPLKIIPCGDLSELQEKINIINEATELIHIHTGVNDLDLKTIDTVHEELLSTITQLRSNFPEIKIILSEITPRFDSFDRDVLKLNALLFQTFKNDSTVYLLRHNNLRKEEFFFDNKHILREQINRLAGNFKFGYRKVFDIKLDRERRPAFSSPSNRQRDYIDRQRDYTSNRQRDYIDRQHDNFDRNLNISFQPNQQRNSNWTNSDMRNTFRSVPEVKPRFNSSHFNKEGSMDKFVQLLNSFLEDQS